MMKTLPDILNPNMKVLFVGTNPGKRSARIGHYFAGRSNMFWKLLYESKLTKERLSTDLDHKIREYGFGLTDVIKRPTLSTSLLKRSDVIGAKKRIDSIIRKHRPKIVAFVGKRGFRYYLRDDYSVLKYGFQDEKIFSSKVFLLPSTSGASYADSSYNRKLFWFRSLRKSIK